MWKLCKTQFSKTIKKIAFPYKIPHPHALCGVLLVNDFSFAAWGGELVNWNIIYNLIIANSVN